MKNYRNKDTGVIWTYEELQQVWRETQIMRERGEYIKHKAFEDMLADMEETDEDAD